MKPDTEQIIEALRAGAWAAEIKLMDLAADRLEELQRESDEARAEVERLKFLREAALPLMQWLAENCHPHVTAIVDSEHVELLEGLATARRQSKEAK